jgi:hypothetical protein
MGKMGLPSTGRFPLTRWQTPGIFPAYVRAVFTTAVLYESLSARGLDLVGIGAKAAVCNSQNAAVV